MSRRLIAVWLVSLAGFALPAAASTGGSINSECNPAGNPYHAYFCVYLTGGREKANSNYTVTLHFLNRGSRAIRGQVNAYMEVAQAQGMGSVPGYVPVRVVSPVHYVMTSNRVTKWARVIGVPSGLKPHQDLQLKLVYRVGRFSPRPNPGLLFTVQYWIGPLTPGNGPSAPVVGDNAFYPGVRR